MKGGSEQEGMSDLSEVAELLQQQEEGKKPIGKDSIKMENGERLCFQLFYTKRRAGITYVNGANNLVELMPDEERDYKLRIRGSPFEVRQARTVLEKIATIYSQPSVVGNFVVPEEREKAAVEFFYLANLAKLLSPNQG